MANRRSNIKKSLNCITKSTGKNLARQVNHRIHQITKDFVDRCYNAGVSPIVIWDLTGIREIIQYGTKMNQRLHVWSFAKVMEQIRYKAMMRGMMTVVQIFEAYTSQTCHQCGNF